VVFEFLVRLRFASRSLASCRVCAPAPCPLKGIRLQMDSAPLASSFKTDVLRVSVAHCCWHARIEGLLEVLVVVAALRVLTQGQGG
jgi:hypothetical protein